ncbi:RagB/SusD family nutrient uptake outer membrane protein [Pedobacter sp. SD-b]|uniref:RagB/SusD family nutrient uptake outer membrane protein n=1 Tax=Pedobacter segetis TaxID=2793069 RepID=A0ABS1BL94_9SPHI|nr:RagB/SusD family nutrient uptake outer membrane protein [Pedobacter segetis]MBK0383647.1 RagB/SusD family nutrient uptake outer membrane protein [Pedobacter segetis]
MKVYKILILSGVFALGSCTKDLNPVDYGDINTSIFPKSASDIDALVNAAYYPLRGAYGNGIFSTSEKGVMYLSDATTETLHGAYGDQLLATLHNFNPQDLGFTHYYDDYNNKISMMTQTIDLINKSSVSEEVKRKAIAQVRCARGLLAYTLFDLYGPLVVAPLDVLNNPLVEAPLARLSNDDMVKFIEDDLTAADADLPLPSEAEYGRFSKGLAKMILIRLNLHEKRYDKVLALANDIIGYGTYQLDPNYVGMWDLEGAKNSKEVIWAIPCDYAGTSENQWQLMVLPANFSPKGGFGTIQSTWYFYDSFEPTDKRRTMLISQYTGTDGITYNRSSPGTFLNYGPLPLKINQDANRTTGLTTVDIIMYRYADVLLSKAEAIANLAGAGTQPALDLVNQIRERAGLADKQLANYTSLADFNDLILLERSHEFWCENGQYRADLIRMGKFVSRCKLVENSVYTNDSKKLYPFSLTAVSEGKGKFIQNPGYN